VSTPKSWAQKRLNRGNFWGNPWSEKPLARELGWDEVAESGMNPSVHIHITAELADLPIVIMIPLTFMWSTSFFEAKSAELRWRELWFWKINLRAN